jgi:hypothetical protein
MSVLDRDKVLDLIANKDFSQGRRYLRILVDTPDLPAKDLPWAVQKLALCTYKDPELQTELALDEAFQLLEKRADLNSTDDPEALSLAGAIQKRMWEVSGDMRALSRSGGAIGDVASLGTKRESCLRAVAIDEGGDGRGG